ncbi:hypothetical protein ACLB2K_027257 [Fragaria x ananassa]
MDPWSHAAYLRQQLLYLISYDVDERLYVLNELSISDTKAFIAELWSQLQQDDDSFQSYKGELMANLLLKHQSLSEETGQFWHEITKRYESDLDKRVAEEVKSLQRRDVINFYRTYLQQSSPKCRRLAIRVWGCNTDFKEPEARPESAQVIEDLAAFNSLICHPTSILTFVEELYAGFLNM